ncbi:MAG: saccharopine dehydrogenase family protein [bacterium]
MKNKYIILGAGLQGVAAAYDFGRFGEAEQIMLADADLKASETAAAHVNRLLDSNITAHTQLDVAEVDKVRRLLKEYDVCLSAVPYYFNETLTQCAIQAGCHFCDLGGNTEVVFKQHELHPAAQKAGITVAPDCGLAPGMANILAAYGIHHLERPRSVQIHVGGLPQNPKPPLDYALSFSIVGLTNEYFGRAPILRNGKVTLVDTFTELEEIEFPAPVGKCESFITHGGTSTCPWTFEGKLETYTEKTVRYPGHYEKMKTIYDLGLLDEQPVQVGESSVIPRQVFHAVAEPRLTSDDPRDVVVLRVIVEGDDGKMVLELMDFYDETTGFTAMQRTTGFGATIVGILMARGETPAGSIRIERAIEASHYVRELKYRGFNLNISH